jgi:hypothetical protein
VRPAVSVGRTTALDEFVDVQHLDLGHHAMGDVDFDNYLGFPSASISDNQLLENGILPITDHFSLEFDHMAGNHADFADDFNINDFLNHDTEGTHCAPPEIQSEIESAETTASLQPPIGASPDGCDDGRNAVSV